MVFNEVVPTKNCAESGSPVSSSSLSAAGDLALALADAPENAVVPGLTPTRDTDMKDAPEGALARPPLTGKAEGIVIVRVIRIGALGHAKEGHLVFLVESPASGPSRAVVGRKGNVFALLRHVGVGVANPFSIVVVDRELLGSRHPFPLERLHRSRRLPHSLVPVAPYWSKASGTGPRSDVQALWWAPSPSTS